MSFVYEMVGEENRELWESIGWKDFFESPKSFYKKSYWSWDRQRNIYLIGIGGYIDMPDYYDICYKQRIIRMEVVGKNKRDINNRVKVSWKINNIYIPKSVWQEKDDILIAIKDAFSVMYRIVPKEEVDEINVEVKCNPQCVEADYNGR